MNLPITTPQHIEQLDVASLEPYARNSRTHSPEQVGQIAASIREFGFTNPVLVDEAGGIIAGHGRVMAAKSLGLERVPCIRLAHLTEQQRRAYVIADNKLALNAGWDEAVLAAELRDLEGVGFDLGLVGFTADELAELLGNDDDSEAGEGDAEAVPEAREALVSRTGEVWLLGRHRVMCGDSTVAEDVARLCNGERAALLHADPPYGMGKQADGVANDNLYNDKLDAFQMSWWRAFRPHLLDNASAYIWGNAPELWRLWWRGGLAESEKLTMRNEIVWDKTAIPGMASADMLCYPVASERCLYFQFGQQFIGNVNADEFPDTWEPLRAYLSSAADAAGITPATIRELCGCGMYSHWFSRSQFTLIPERHYATLRQRFPEHFTREWAELKAEWARVRGGARDVINQKQGVARSYFDNAHDSMIDVWRFPRVYGEDRHGHATPKPVSMMERVMRSSLPDGGLCLEPFGGSGATLMGAHTTGRTCYTMELQARYVDVIIRRWQDYTGQPATLEGDGRTFAQVAKAREAG